MAIDEVYRAELTAAGVGYADLVVVNHEPKSVVLTWVGVDVTDAVFEAQVRARPDDPDPPLAEWSVGTAELVEGDTVVTFTLAQADIVALPAGPEPAASTRLYTSFRFTPAGGALQTIFGGTLTRTGSATHG